MLDNGIVDMLVGAWTRGGYETEEESCSDNSAGIHWSSDHNLHKGITN